MDSLESLISRVRKSAGLELYLWSCGRPEFNDYIKDDESVYLRATRGMVNPSKYSKYDFSMPKDIFWTFSGQDFGAGRDKDYNVIFHGPIIEEFHESCQDYKKSFEKALNLIKSQKRNLLSKYVSTLDQSDAYFVRMLVQNDLTDSGKRASPASSIIIVADKQLVTDIVNYIKNNPKDYYSLVRGLFPKDEFPNVNREILDRTVQVEDILFLDAEKLPQNIKNSKRKILGAYDFDDMLKFTAERKKTK